MNVLKHLKYIGAGLALLAVAVGLVLIIALCSYILSVVSCPIMWGALMVLIVAWVIGQLLDPAS